MKKALIFDLDDTIYPTRSVANDMYKDLFALLKQQVSSEVFEKIREDILTTPFQNVADRYEIDQETFSLVTMEPIFTSNLNSKKRL